MMERIYYILEEAISGANQWIYPATYRLRKAMLRPLSDSTPQNEIRVYEVARPGGVDNIDVIKDSCGFGIRIDPGILGNRKIYWKQDCKQPKHALLVHCNARRGSGSFLPSMRFSDCSEILLLPDLAKKDMQSNSKLVGKRL